MGRKKGQPHNGQDDYDPDKQRMMERHPLSLKDFLKPVHEVSDKEKKEYNPGHSVGEEKLPPSQALPDTQQQPDQVVGQEPVASHAQPESLPAEQTAAGEVQHLREKVEKKARTAIPVNSRLYHEYAPFFLENREDVQSRYASMDAYLEDWLRAFKDGTEQNLPSGCQGPEDVLKPYWESEKIAGVSAGSYFALEHGLEFHRNHAQESLSAKWDRIRKKFGDRENFKVIKELAHDVTLQQRYKGDLGKYLESMKRKLEAGEIGLPEEAADLADAERPLDEAEVKTWFNRRKREFEDYYKRSGAQKYKKAAYQEFIRSGYADYYKEFFPEPINIETPGPESGEKADPENQADFGLSAAQTTFPEARRKRVSQGTSQSEIVRTVTHQAEQKRAEPTEAFVKDFYTLPDGSNLEVKKGEISPIRNARFDRRGDQLVITYERRQDYKGTISYIPNELYVNLPPEIAGNYSQLENELKQTLQGLVEENKGMWKPVISYKMGNLSFGLGGFDQSREVINMPPATFRELSPELAKRYSWYTDLKMTPFEKLKKEQKDELNEFEKQLFRVYVNNDRLGKETSWSQWIFDTAFQKAIEEKLGAEKMKELKEASVSSKTSGPQAAPAEARPAAEQKSEKSQPKVGEFLKKLEDKYGTDYLEFLRSDDVLAALDEFHLKFEDMLLAVAQKGLPAEKLAEFEEALALADKDILKKFLGNDEYHKNKKRNGLLHVVLRKMLEESGTAQPQEEQPAVLAPKETVPSAASANKSTIQNGGTKGPDQTKFRTEPKIETPAEGKGIFPEAEYYSAFLAVKQVMDKYGRLEMSALEQVVAGMKNDESQQKEYSSRVTYAGEPLSTRTLEQALQAMGFLEEYRKGLGEYKNTAEFQKRLQNQVRKEQDALMASGQSMEWAQLYSLAERNIDRDLLIKAVESFYQIRPETLNYESEKLKVPEYFEEIKYSFRPQCVVMKDRVNGFEYFGIPGPKGTWERVPLPDSIDINNPDQIQFLYDTCLAMVKANSVEDKFKKLEFQPEIRLVGGPKNGTFEIYIDRHRVKRVPVSEFVNPKAVRSDVRGEDEHSKVFKELLADSFDKLQHNQSENFSQRDNTAVALRELLLNTPLQNSVSFGDQAKFIALKRRVADARNQRVKGSFDVRQDSEGFVIMNSRAA